MLLSQAANAAPADGQVSIRQLVHQSREQVAAGDLEKALERAQAALALDPAAFEAQAQEGRVLMLLGRREAALASLETALALRPGDPQAEGWRLRLLLDVGRGEELVGRLESLPAATLAGLDPPLSALILERLLDAGQEGLAERAAGVWERSAPEESRRRAARALRLVLAGECSSAAALQKLAGSTTDSGGPAAGESDPLFSLAWLSLGRRQMAEGKAEEAAGSLERARLLRPEWATARRELAGAYRDWAGADPQAAVEPRRRLAGLEPERPESWRDLGHTLWSAGEREEALAVWRRAIAGGVKNREALVRQVVALVAEAGQGERAVALFREWEPGRPLSPLGLELFRLGRVAAAQEVLQAAWEEGERDPATGLHLAAAESRRGLCSTLPEHLAPFLDQRLAVAPAAEWDLLLETVRSCTDDPGLLPVIDRLEAALGTSSERSVRVTDLLEKAGLEREAQGSAEAALALQLRVLARDADRPSSWLRAAQLGRRLGREAEVEAVLAAVLRRTGSPAVREGILGWQADARGDEAAAVEHHRRTLEAEPGQLEVRYALFQDLLALGRPAEARVEASWFEARVATGENAARSHLAEAWTGLGETEKALRLWRELSLVYPDTSHYVVETARALLGLCRAEEAVAVLEDMVSRQPGPRVYELLAEIASTLGRPDEALKWTAEGLAFGRTPGLLRLRAEAAEAAGQPAAALEAAQALLESDRGNVPMALLAGRALLALGREEEARLHYEALLARQPAFLPALVRLREIASRGREPGKAREHARQAAAQGTGGPVEVIRLAVSEAEAERFRAALEPLRALATRPVGGAIPVLVYRDVSTCLYPGRCSSGQVASHLERLAAEGRRLVLPGELNEGRGEPRALLIIEGAEEEALRAVDAALRQFGGRAVYAETAAALEAEKAGAPGAALLAELEAGGRWAVASAGPGGLGRTRVKSDGTLGNPLTHRLFNSSNPEGEEALAARLEGLMVRAAAPSLLSSPRLLLYPGGDYGQLSLDTDPGCLTALGGAVGRHFDLALAAGEEGFVLLPPDPQLRLPGRAVPPAWTADDLACTLREEDPAVLSSLELAKVLYWNRQHERADRWFRRALERGADPGEVSYHRGGNALQQGDLALARRELLRASELRPEDVRVEPALERTRLARRPLLDLESGGWEDSEGRRHLSWGPSLGGYADGPLRLDLLFDRHLWTREGLADVQGTRWGAGFTWHLAPGCWLDGRLWQLALEELPDEPGGEVSLHLPNPAWGGFVELEAGRETEDTLEAVRAGIEAERLACRIASRLRDLWDLYADAVFTRRSDGNDTRLVAGRLVRRLREWPFLGVGYLFRFGDSDLDPPEYWAPEGLQQHQLYLTARGEFGPLHYTATGQAGYADETDSDWRFVWGGRARLDGRLTARLRLYGEFTYLENPTYDRRGWSAGITGRF